MMTNTYSDDSNRVVINGKVCSDMKNVLSFINMTKSFDEENKTTKLLK